MIVYLLNILLIFLFGSLLLFRKPIEKYKKTFCIIAASQWVILSGLRDLSVGADTYSYKVDDFDPVIYQPWAYLFDRFMDIVFWGGVGKDPGYPIFVKIIQIFTIDYRIYLIIVALIFTIPLGRWIFKNSAEPCISFLIYSCLFYSFFAITGIRQTIATSLVVLCGYEHIIKKEKWAFFLLFIVAFTIHKSVLCFLPFYFIANKKITKNYIITFFILMPVAFIFKNEIMFILGNTMGYERYIDQFEGAGTLTFTIVLLLLTIVSIWRYELMLKNNLQVTHYLNALFMAWIFVPLTYIDPSAMRVVQYYSLFLMLLVPEIIHSFNVRERLLVYYVAAASLILLFIKTDPQYLFFWQV